MSRAGMRPGVTVRSRACSSPRPIQTMCKRRSRRQVAAHAKGKKGKKGGSQAPMDSENVIGTTATNGNAGGAYLPNFVDVPRMDAGINQRGVDIDEAIDYGEGVHEVEFLKDTNALPDLGVLEGRPRVQMAPQPNTVPVPHQHANYQIQRYLKPLPRVLLLHTGGTLGMDPSQSYIKEETGDVQLKEGTGGVYPASDNLQPGEVLSDLLTAVPELTNFAHLDVEIVFNIDSCRIGPKQWIQLAKLLHKQRQNYDAFLVVHGTDTMSFTAAALSLMLKGFKKPIVLTGSQLPLAMPRSDARQNLIDSITCATAACLTNPLSRYPVHFEEVAICFGGKLMRGNRTRKVHSSVYQAFDSPMYPHLAELGVEVEWNHSYLLEATNDVYQPRFKLNTNVIRVPIVPGVDPRKAYGDLYERGVRGVVLEAFGVGNMPDNPSHGWLPWLKQQRKKGLQLYLCSQCSAGNLHPELYRSGSVALNMGVESGRQMTPECAVIKMMFCLEYKDIPLSQPIAGEL